MGRQSSRRRIALVCALVLLTLTLVVSVTFWGSLKARCQFLRLHLSRRDPPTAMRLSDALAKSPDGVRLALDDLSIHRRSTRGWSSYILRTSRLSELVEGELTRIAGSDDERLARRVAALWIMWRRTGEKEYLLRLFESVKDPGESFAIEGGRHFLAAALTDSELWTLFKAPKEQAVNMDTVQFERIISKPGSLQLDHLATEQPVNDLPADEVLHTPPTPTSADDAKARPQEEDKDTPAARDSD